jgi:DNA-binding transcriptional ArsR family regulator
MPAAGRDADVAPRRVVNLDADQLKVLAHPLRARILGSLRSAGPATASVLGERLGESSGQTSYHLRSLAKVGLVSELADRGNRRDRWWESAHDVTSWATEDFLDDPDAAAAADWFVGFATRTYAQRASAWLERRGEVSDEWVVAADMSDFALRLTPEGLTELNRKLLAVLNEAVDHQADADDDTAQPCVVLLQSFPDPDALPPDD